MDHLLSSPRASLLPRSTAGVRRMIAAALGLTLVNASFPLGTGAQQPGDWTMPARDFAATRFSPLTQIHSGNVHQLREEFRFRTGIEAGHEGAPLVVNNTMYIVSPFPNIVFALDLSRPGHTRWVFDPKPDPVAEDKACCDIVNRRAVYAGGKIIFNTLDNQTIALDAISGQEVWRTRLGDPAQGQTIGERPF